ncbi:MAG: GNAT family N-acetyltransferase [Parvibaculaceae bacterium]
MFETDEDGVTIRMAAAADVPQLAQVWHDSWQAGHAHLDPVAAEHRDLPYFQARIGSGLDRMIVAVERGKIVGFSGWEGDGIGQVFVAPSHIGKGIAPRLLATVEAILKAEGHRTIWLHCREGNERARRFYEKHGWQVVRTIEDQIGTHIGFLPAPTWHLEKDI